MSNNIYVNLKLRSHSNLFSFLTKNKTLRKKGE
nr:MAG TPA: hypothetical protein [Caudoviricetes sp.]